MPRAYSYSALNMYRNCPRQFKFRYIEKPAVPRRINADTYLGTAVHRVLRQVHQLGADGVVMTVEQMLDQYRRQWESVDREYLMLPDEFRGVDDVIRSGERMLRTYYDQYRPFDEGTLLGTEKHLSFQVADLPVKFRAYIDRLWKRDDGVVEICDYKTGQHLAQPTDASFMYQMGLYQLAVQQAYPQFTKIELAQYFLRMNEVVRYQLADEQLEQLADEMRSLVLEIQRAQRLDDFPPVEGGLCRFCEYIAVCPAKRHRALIADDEAQPSDERSLSRKAQELANRYLEAYAQARDAKAALDSLKADLIEFAREYDLSRMEGDAGHVNVRLSRKEKFITRSADAAAFAELAHLARQLQLEDYFVPDVNALMKEVYKKQRLQPDQLEQLKPFVVEREEVRVTATLKRETNDDREDPEENNS